jgi:hypothetical protein
MTDSLEQKIRALFNEEYCGEAPKEFLEKVLGLVASYTASTPQNSDLRTNAKTYLKLTLDEPRLVPTTKYVDYCNRLWVPLDVAERLRAEETKQLQTIYKNICEGCFVGCVKPTECEARKKFKDRFLGAFATKEKK